MKPENLMPYCSSISPLVKVITLNATKKKIAGGTTSSNSRLIALKIFCINIASCGRHTLKVELDEFTP